MHIPTPTLLQTIRSVGMLPFTTTIMEALMPEKPPPALNKYDGSSNSDDHVRQCYDILHVQLSSYVQGFSLSLKGETLASYNTFPPNTVDCFTTVKSFFGRRYAYSRIQKLTHVVLVSTRQEKEDTLKTFMKRYNELIRSVKDVNPTFIINKLSSCLKPKPFTNSMCVEPLRRRTPRKRYKIYLH